MLCGTAVIGSSSGAIPEVIDDATMIFPEGDAGALAKLLTRLSQTPGLNDAERCRARRDRVLAEFTWARVAERYHAVFDRLVGGTGAGPGATGVRERMEAAVPG
jgi:glycosyltransferase involved in cell wall biosynthesis